MGLDITHDCWNGAYSAFSRWRQKIAEAAGYWVLPVTYPDGGGTHPTIILDWHRYQNGELFGEWRDPPRDPLLVLFVHSDCEGVIHPEQAGPLADALESLLPKLQGDGGGHIGDYREKTQNFINGLRAAAAAGEDVEFH